MSKKVKEVVVEEVLPPVIEEPTIKIVNLDGTEADVAYQTSNSAGIDLTISDNYTIYKGAEPIMVKTGLRLMNTGIEGVVGILSLRSSKRKEGLSTMGIGVIDVDYEGEICVPLLYLGPKTGVRLLKGERLAQITFVPIYKIDAPTKEVVRGDGGFGSTN